MKKIVSAMTAFAVAVSAWSYEIDTHRDLTRQAFNASQIVRDPGLLKDIGLDDPAQRYPNSQGVAQTIQNLIEFGSRYEDNVSVNPLEVRVTKHFYNPLTGRGLSAGAVLPQTASPDWALEDKDTQSGQEFSYRDARQYFLDGLTKSGETERTRGMGRMFQSIGHVAHHLQDMAQPQHVRNDAHCDNLICGPLGIFSPSLYEKLSAEADAGSFGAREAVYPQFKDALKTPRSFFQGIDGVWRLESM